MFPFSTTVFAEEISDSLVELETEFGVEEIPLTAEERSYLINESGFNEDQLNFITASVARELIKNEAEVVSSGKIEAQLQPGSNTLVPILKNELLNQFSTNSISSSDVDLNFAIVKLNDDLNGYKKYQTVTGFQWKKNSINFFVDKLSIGFPSHMGVYFKTSNGYLSQHSHQYYLYNTSTGKRTNYTLKTNPDNWSPSLGVVGAFDLVATGSVSTSYRHGGTMSQIFYVPNSKIGQSFNIKFEYGHRILAGTVGISYPSTGISLVPTTATKVMNKAGSVTIR